MVRALSTLKKRAQKGTKWRGHSMRWQSMSATSNLLVGTCKKCGMQVTCNNQPLPNEVGLGGEAIALNCPESDALRGWMCLECGRMYDDLSCGPCPEQDCPSHEDREDK